MIVPLLDFEIPLVAGCKIALLAIVIAQSTLVDCIPMLVQSSMPAIRCGTLLVLVLEFPPLAAVDNPLVSLEISFVAGGKIALWASVWAQVAQADSVLVLIKFLNVDVGLGTLHALVFPAAAALR